NDRCGPGSAESREQALLTINCTAVPDVSNGDYLMSIIYQIKNAKVSHADAPLRTPNKLDASSWPGGPRRALSWLRLPHCAADGACYVTGATGASPSASAPVDS